MQVHESTTVGALADLRVDGARLWDSLMQLAQIGATDKGGVCRLALTELDREARDLFIAWSKEIGCSVRIDAIGNIFARRAGLRDDLPPVMTGSHIDTQPTGGKFDGNYGVLAGLEVLRTLADANVRTLAPLEVAVWTNEEGSRFVPVMMGSGVFAGAFTLEHALEQRDREGMSVRDALASIGYAGESGKPHAVGAYFEAHIEQGPVLEAHDMTIGVVQGALGQRWYDVTVHGMEARRGGPDSRGESHCPRSRAAWTRYGWLARRASELAQRDSWPCHPDGRSARGGRRFAHRDGCRTTRCLRRRG
jgi:N-carbamoyl-L-amino-acid hydrolase